MEGLEKEEELAEMDFEGNNRILSSCSEKLVRLKETLQDTRKRLVYKNAEILEKQTE